jgi:predicted lipoprotein with Yx(FWY)xxD motif
MLMNRTRLPIVLVAVIAAAAIAVIAGTSGAKSTKPSQPAVPAGTSISVEQTSVGKAITDAQGRTLYLFAADKPNLSTLSAAGRAFWPPFTSTSRPAAAGGALAGKIGVVSSGAAGARQVTYNGHPLYYFVGDRKPGQIAGQGLNQFGARWYLLSPAGAAITSAPRSQPASNSGGGGAYGY